MIRILICFLCISFCDQMLAQDIRYGIQADYWKPVQTNQLLSAETMSDINAGYPTSWIKNDDYISTEITTINDGEIVQAIGKTNILNKEQKKILRAVDMGEHVNVIVKYNAENTVTGKSEINTMNFTVTLIPTVEADFPGGEESLRKYLKENMIDLLSEEEAKKIEIATASFVINKNGKAENSLITTSTNNEAIDQLLLKVLNDLPAWRPAKNAKGEPINQKFVLQIGMMAGC